MMAFPIRDNDSAGLRVFAGRLGGLVLAVAVSLACGGVAFGQPGKFKKGAAKKKTAKKKSKTEEEMSKHAQKLLKWPSLKIRKPLMDIAGFKKTQSALRKMSYNELLLNGILNDKAKTMIPKWIDWRLRSFTMKDFEVKVRMPAPPGAKGPAFVMQQMIVKNDIGERRREFMTEIRRAGGIVGKALPPQMRRFRTAVCQEITKQAVKLLDNNFYVRLHVILVLKELDVMPSTGRDTPPEMHPGVVKPLLEQVLLDPKQPDPLKVAAVNGLKRFAHLGKDVPRVDRQKIADGFRKEFARPKTHPWYQRRLVEAMGALDLPKDTLGKAILLQTLAETLSDTSRNDTVRFQAAHALGRASKPGDLNVDLLIHELVRFGTDMAKKYNAEVAKGKVRPHWQNSYLLLFLAFHPDHGAEFILYTRRVNIPDRKPWLLTRYAGNAKVKGGYDQIKKLTMHVLNQRRGAKPAAVPDVALTMNATWLTTNRPTNFSLQPGVLPALRPIKAAARKGPVKSAARDKKSVAGPTGP